jgi:hypothetical protein
MNTPIKKRNGQFFQGVSMPRTTMREMVVRMEGVIVIVGIVRMDQLARHPRDR